MPPKDQVPVVADDENDEYATKNEEKGCVELAGPRRTFIDVAKVIRSEGQDRESQSKRGRHSVSMLPKATPLYNTDGLIQERRRSEYC